MMKYLRTYESVEYNEGDYVILNNFDLYGVSPCVKVVLRITSNVENINYVYQVTALDESDDFFVDDTEIKRRATDKEIEKYKFKKDVNKYNL